MAKPSQGLTQQQQQQLRLNARQMLLGRLIEMSEAEFEEEIVKAIEENPAIAVTETIDEYDDMPEGGADSFSVQETSEYADDADSTDDVAVHYRSADRASAHFALVAAGASEAEQIEAQLSEMNLTEIERETARYIIGNLDSSGYLTRTTAAIVDDMATTAGIEVNPETVEKVRKIVKSLDPAGIGAENLRECLLIQLKRLPAAPAVGIAREILDRYYKPFVNNRLDSVRDRIPCDDDTFAAAVRLLRSLNPKPGLGLFEYDNEVRTRHISPDFIIDLDDSGKPVISLAGNVPGLTVAPSFRIDPAGTRNPAATEFVRERREGAEEFIDAVIARSKTLLSVMRAIIRLQPEFFHSFEPSDLRPMVLRDVAELTGYDKSVISRATSTKYILTPQGMFPLKSLFGESASSVDDLSPREVEDTLRSLIENEDKQQPLNDDDLTALLNAAGMPIARRTVAKYRERLGIPVARLRRKSVEI